MFILDEPTASLVPMAEYEIYKHFHKITEDSGAVIITHRLSAVQLADKIAVFDGGEIIEYGTHRELFEEGGTYREMFDKHSEFFVVHSSESPESIKGQGGIR